jgi:hypothetical protein
MEEFLKNLILTFLSVFILMPTAKAAVGVNAGLGFPYVSQVGLDLTLGSNLSLTANHNALDIDVDEAEVGLQMQEIGVRWHPFSGAFFIGAGIGRQALKVKAVEETTGAEASVDVTSTTSIAKLGWMWGRDDGGLWFGIDIALIIPSGGEVDVEADGLTEADQEFQDVQDAGEQFAETSYTNITFARLGYLF